MMDIPQLPSEITIKLSPSSPLQKLGVQDIVPVEQLNLIPNKTYQGHALSTLAKFLSQVQTSSSDSKPAAVAKDNWLILLQGKLINVKSEAPLQEGQKLSLKLATTGLLLQALSSKSSLSANTDPKPLLSTQEMAGLVKGVNQVISNQLPVEKGLSLLSHMAKSAPDKVVSQQVNAVIATLVKALPLKEKIFPDLLPQTKSSLPVSPEQASRPDNSPTPSKSAIPSRSEMPIAQVIKQTLEASGMFLERELASNKASIVAFEKLVQQVVQQVQPRQDSAQAVSTTQTAAPKPSLKEAIQSFWSAQTSKMGHQAQAGANPSFSPTAPQSGVQAPLPDKVDLKTLLLGLVSGISQASKQPLSAEAMNDPELLQMPFNFPPAVSNQVLKAESILADQDLTTGQLLKLLAGILNRLQFNQLNSLYQTQAGSAEPGVTQQSWFFELPMVNAQHAIETFNLRIDKETRDQSGESDAEKQQEIQWKIALSFNFDELGDIYIQTFITPPSISSTIWANQSSTLALINKEQSHFRERLSELGLEVGDIVCQYGQPKVNKAKLDRNLVDITA